MSTQAMAFVDWLATALAAAGLRHAFGVPGGGSSLDLLAALKRAKVHNIITAREDAAVIMAGVAGMLGQGPGLAFTTKGPGLASACNGLASAALDRLPALLISETFDAGELSYLSHQVFRQSALVAPLLAEAGGQELPPTCEAVQTWLSGPNNRPAVMFPSLGELQAPVANPTGPDAAPPAQLPDLGPALELLAGARRPVVVVGLEAANATAVPALRELTTALGAPALTTYMAKGTIADADPHYAGIFTSGAIEQAIVGQADLILLIGLDPVELIRKPWPYDAAVLDICERLHEPHYLRPAVRVLAPLDQCLSLLAGQVSAGDWTAAEIAALRHAYFDGMGRGGTAALSSSGVVQAAAVAFAGPTPPRLTVDAGAHMFSACAFWPAAPPRDVLISNGLASMGFALPAGIAAALFDPTRGALAMIGDGGLMMCLGELKTAAEAACNLTVVVFNDGCLSLIDIKRQERQFADLGLSWKPPDFAAIARGFGFRAWRVEDAAGLRTALAEAAACTGPRLIDIRIDASGYPE